VVEATDKTIIGTLSNEPEITLELTSEGRESFRFAITRFSSSSTVAVVVPKSNSTLTTERFALDVERTVTRLFRVRTSSSIREEIWASTISGDAPGYGVTMDACGTSNEGSSSCFKEVRDRSPEATISTVNRPTTERLASEAVANLNKDIP
jgi:hypothetical protein